MHWFISTPPPAHALLWPPSLVCTRGHGPHCTDLSLHHCLHHVFSLLPCAGTSHRSETSASSRETHRDGGVTHGVISPVSDPTDLELDWMVFPIPTVSKLQLHFCSETKCWPTPQQCQSCMSPPAVTIARVLLSVLLQTNPSHRRGFQASYGLS